MARDWHGLCFTNLVDFDAVYGHRRDPLGDGLALEEDVYKRQATP